MTQSDRLLSLSNPLASPTQISATGSASLLDGVPQHLFDTVRCQGVLLTQAAGILLRLSQDIVARAIIILDRFYTAGPEGGSVRSDAIKEFSAACLYLTAKSSATPVTTRSLLNVYTYLLSPASTLSPSAKGAPSQLDSTEPPDPATYTLTASEYQTALLHLQRNETAVLRALSFVTKSVLPHGLALTYLSTLGALPTNKPSETSSKLAARTLALLNTALLSPQRLYLTHQPHALAVAAVYLAARETGVRLVGHDTGSWWEIFDVGREELGFLTVGMLSVQGWMDRERELGRGLGRGSNGRWLVSLEDLEEEIRGSERTEDVE